MDSTHRQTAAQYLGTAVRELFPHVHLMGGEGTSRFFYYDFAFPFPFQKEMLSLIEERMHALLREKRPVKELEMMPSNAADLMDSQDQPLIANRLRAVSTSLVPLCQVGDSIDYCPHPFSKEHFKFFKLIEAMDIQGTIRIVGILEESKDLLKKRVKEAAVSSNNHLQLVESLQLFFPLEGRDAWVWLPRAKQIRDVLCAWWKKEHREQNFKFICSTSLAEEEMTQAHLECLTRKGFLKTAELGVLSTAEDADSDQGLFSTTRSFTDRAYLHCTKEKLLEEVISSLQFILKIPKILCFEFEILLSISSAGNQKEGRRAVDVFKQALDRLGLSFTTCKEHHNDLHVRIDVQLFDSLGRKWRGPFMGALRSRSEGDFLVRSAFGPMERLFGVILENTSGEIPLWLSTEMKCIEN